MGKFVTRKPVRKTRSDDWYDEDHPLLPSLQVEETPPRYTGILDRHGNEYVELPEPIGFRKRDGV